MGHPLRLELTREVLLIITTLEAPGNHWYKAFQEIEDRILILKDCINDGLQKTLVKIKFLILFGNVKIALWINIWWEVSRFSTKQVGE